MLFLVRVFNAAVLPAFYCLLIEPGLVQLCGSDMRVVQNGLDPCNGARLLPLWGVLPVGLRIVAQRHAEDPVGFMGSARGTIDQLSTHWGTTSLSSPLRKNRCSALSFDLSSSSSSLRASFSFISRSTSSFIELRSNRIRS